MNFTTLRPVLLFLFLGMFQQNILHAAIASSVTTNHTVTISKKEVNKNFKMHRRLARFENFMSERGMDSTDAGQWLIYGIAGIGAAILLGIFGLGGLAALAALIGVVCLVVWFIKWNNNG